MSFWLGCFVIIAEGCIAAFLLMNACTIRDVSKKQFRRLIPQKVKQIRTFVIIFAVAFILQAAVTGLSLTQYIRHMFRPEQWSTTTIFAFAVTFIVYDIVAIVILLHIHNMNFLDCSLESLKDFKNSCLLGESFLVDDEIEVSGDAESEPDINHGNLGGKFKSVLLDVNRSSYRNKSTFYTFDTSDMKEYYGTEIDEKTDCGDDYRELTLDKFESKEIPGTQPDDSPPFDNMNIKY